MEKNGDYTLADLLDPNGGPVALQAQDVAVLLGCGPDAARNLMKSEGFPILRTGARTYVVLKRDLLKWLDNLEQKGRKRR
jgi:hypothetical protein